MNSMKAYRLVARRHDWSQRGIRGNVLDWAKEGEPMTVTFTAEQIKEFQENGYELRFERIEL
jgi:hypothetical protein